MIESSPLIAALTIGLAAGLNAGPLSIVVIQQTLQHGLRAGLRVCAAPLITDGPIIAVSVVLLNHFQGNQAFIVLISVLGGAYLLYLGAKTLFLTDLARVEQRAPVLRLGQIVKVNAFNPNPYLFWSTIGGAYIVSAPLVPGLGFALVLLSTLVGSKVAIACFATVFRERMEGPVYAWVNRGLGLALACYGAVFLFRAYSVPLS